MTFQAPDNLTAYRLMAVAADAGERFGSGDKRMTVRKPLQLLSAMPRFLNVGDDAKGGVLVVNDTGKAGQRDGRRDGERRAAAQRRAPGDRHSSERARAGVVPAAGGASG